jgi:hypothetical protein
VVLRTAAVWGTTVLALKNLRPGQSFGIGDHGEAVLPKPDGVVVSELPVRAVGKGWELDARGATGGSLFLRGRRENPVALAASGAPIPIVAGDFGLLLYDNFGVFFQFTETPPALRRRRRFDWAWWLSLVFSAVAVGGGLALVWAITTPPPIPKPLELTSHAELLAQFNLKAEDFEPPPEVGKKEDDAGQSKKESGAKQEKEQGGGKQAARREGSLGRQGTEKETELTGEVRQGLGGMAEALSSDVGEEVRKTLGTISSVADALGGLSSQRIVLGRGGGMGLKGTAAGGGGDGPGVPFGAGTLDTGWGAGRGGGLGAGAGRPGGPGAAGRGAGATGDGDGDGSGERKLAGKDAAKPGQGLSPGQISRVVMSRMGAFRACYETAAARDPSIKGNVSMSFSITPGGSVGGASVASSSLGNPRVEGCIQRMFSRLSFPTADKPTNASWTFSFRPSKK